MRSQSPMKELLFSWCMTACSLNLFLLYSVTIFLLASRQTTMLRLIHKLNTN
uniref:Uncharacterized protein n=1 Tax=Rhizophora mucronata TaxID=61149 RepID=A0A2P2JUZ3_RHIMU